MGRVGSAYDNAISESFVSTFKGEIGVNRYPTSQTARASMFEFIESLYDRARRHSSLGYISPLSTSKLQWRRQRWRKRKSSVNLGCAHYGFPLELRG